MPKPRTFLSVALILWLVLLPKVLRAQQGEIPPASTSEEHSIEDGSQSERIVAHRPRLYSIKRAAHPVSWLEGGIAPALRLAEKFGADASEKKAPRDSGVQFGVMG